MYFWIWQYFFFPLIVYSILFYFFANRAIHFCECVWERQNDRKRTILWGSPFWNKSSSNQHLSKLSALVKPLELLTAPWQTDKKRYVDSFYVFAKCKPLARDHFENLSQINKVRVNFFFFALWLRINGLKTNQQLIKTRLRAFKSARAMF